MDHCYVTRCPDAFAAELAQRAKVDPYLVRDSVAAARTLHAETHMAMEFISELSCRAMVCYRLSALFDESEFTRLLTEVCSVSEATRERLHAVLKRSGVPTLFWEDVVLHAARTARRASST